MSADLPLPDSLSSSQRRVTTELVGALVRVPGVVAVGLGGSHARGLARPDSDVDLGVFYRESAPFSVRAIRSLARDAQLEGEPVVTDFYEWGDWVNGGAWIDSEAGRVDLLYRAVELVERVIADCRAGRTVWDYPQTPVYGFHSVVYMGEARACIPLHDPQGVLARLAESARDYPAALQQRIVSSQLGHAEFSLLQARKLAARGDVYNTAGCLTRALAALTQALFALNETCFLNDKDALATIEGFARRPPRHAERVTRILRAPGGNAAELSGSVGEADALFSEVVLLAGELYRLRFAEAASA